MIAEASPSSRGQALVEFALAFPLLLLLSFGILDFGRAMSAYIELAHTAREGARSGIYTSATDADIRNTVKAQAPLLGLADGDISISPTYPRTSGDNLQVTITYNFNSFTPLVNSLWGGGTLPLTSVARMNVE